jgi:hypothetical protein
MGGHLTTVLAVGGIGGSPEPVERLLGDLPETGADAVVMVGDLGAAGTARRAIFKALGELKRPVFWVPGPGDAPIRDYLRECYNMELVFPLLRGLHGTAALGPGDILFAGMGGQIDDDPDTPRDEETTLRYPGWEAEYRLKILREFDELQKALIFATPPAHKGLGEPGSEVLAELINTYRPRLAVVGGDEPTEHLLGRTLVVCPGRLDQGRYGLVDMREHTFVAATLGAGRPATV